MNLLIISGLSGSGKSIALNTLEDLDYYCIDNLPVGMLPAIAQQMTGEWGRLHRRVAVGIDARNNPQELQRFPHLLEELQSLGVKSEIFFLQAEENTLLKRFSETRRKHPLTRGDTSLADAIRQERALLEPIIGRAALFLDTTNTTIYQLRELIRNRVSERAENTMSLLIQSFGFKHGIPSDADFVFDVRCLPNPHWKPNLRRLTGLDPPVIRYLEAQADVRRMREQLQTFLDAWIPQFEKENRSYMTVAIGCTGGQHRSVYLATALAEHFRAHGREILLRHRELA